MYYKKRTMKNLILALLITAGLCLAMSDGPAMPWPNLVGCGALVGALIIGKLFNAAIPPR